MASSLGRYLGAAFLAGAGSYSYAKAKDNEKNEKIEGREHFVFRLLGPGYVVVGTTHSASSISDRVAKKQLDEGNFVSCDHKLPSQNLISRKYSKLPILLTGTKDPSKCKDFFDMYMTRVTRVAAGAISEETIDFDNPLLATPVYKFEGDFLEEIGTLARLSEEEKKAIVDRQFTYCQISADEATLPGAVIIGTENKNICNELTFFQFIKKISE